MNIVGIETDTYIMSLVGSIFLLFFVTVGILILRLDTVEVKFTFSHPMVEISVSSVLKIKKKFVEKKEISEIFIEYTEKPKGIYQALHVKFKDGIESIYFGSEFFTKNEIDYFNNEIKKLLSYDYNSY